jgi:hypothetical protein
MTHHVIDMEVISTLPDEVLTTQTKCSKHPDFIMDFFCNQHHVICCGRSYAKSIFTIYTPLGSRNVFVDSGTWITPVI